MIWKPNQCLCHYSLKLLVSNVFKEICGWLVKDICREVCRSTESCRPATGKSPDRIIQIGFCENKMTISFLKYSVSSTFEARGCCWAFITKIHVVYLMSILTDMFLSNSSIGSPNTLLSYPPPTPHPRLTREALLRKGSWGRAQTSATENWKVCYQKATPHMHSLAHLNCCPHVWVSVHTYTEHIHCLSPIPKILITSLGFMGLLRRCKEKQGASLHRSRVKGCRLYAKQSTTGWVFIKHKMERRLHAGWRVEHLLLEI